MTTSRTAIASTNPRGFKAGETSLTVIDVSQTARGELVFGASVYFPPFFKAFAFGFVIWLVVHRLLRGWIYAGDIWHPLLMDLSLFAICVCLAVAILIAW